MGKMEQITIMGQQTDDINSQIDQRLNSIYQIEQNMNIAAILTGCLMILISFI